MPEPSREEPDPLVDWLAKDAESTRDYDDDPVNVVWTIKWSFWLMTPVLLVIQLVQTRDDWRGYALVFAWGVFFGFGYFWLTPRYRRLLKQNNSRNL